jgi:hypothetical protein
MMKHVKTLLGGLTCLALSISACNKNNDHGGLTNELGKIETIWDGVSEKNEKDVSGVKTVSLGSPQELKALQEKIQQRFNHYVSRGSGPVTELLGNWVGVIKSNWDAGGCNGYDVLQISMDCEDNNARTSYIGGFDGTYRPHWDVNGNMTMRFCIVPGNDFHDFTPTNIPGQQNFYGVLRVTTQRLPDAYEVGRHFDNEDRRNANSVSLTFGNIRTPGRAGQTIGVHNNWNDDDNSILSTVVNENTDLSIHVFGNTNDGSQPYINIFPYHNGLSYGVFGLPYIGYVSGDNAAIFVDDEDTRNLSTWYTDEERYVPPSNGLDDATNRAIFSKGTFESHFIMYAAEYAGGFIRRGGQDTEMYISGVR